MSVAFLTTSSSMVAFINNIVAGAGIAPLVRWLLGPQRTLLAVLAGVAGAAVLMAAYLAFQKWRFTQFEPILPPSPATGTGKPGSKTSQSG
jgi:hypothetical protein